jgi:hypothetical protein
MLYRHGNRGLIVDIDLGWDIFIDLRCILNYLLEVPRLSRRHSPGGIGSLSAHSPEYASEHLIEALRALM